MKPSERFTHSYDSFMQEITNALDALAIASAGLVKLRGLYGSIRDAGFVEESSRPSAETQARFPKKYPNEKHINTFLEHTHGHMWHLIRDFKNDAETAASFLEIVYESTGDVWEKEEINKEKNEATN